MKISQIKLDPSGYIFNNIRVRQMRLNASYHTFIFRILLTLKNVTHGTGVRTFGKTTINRHHMSSISIGDNVVFRSSFKSNLIGLNRRCMISTLNNVATIEIGSGCGLSATVIGAAEKIVLGKNVMVGANTLITDTDWHNIHPDLRRLPCNNSKPIFIDDNVWLGINCVVLKGVHIGKNSVIGANSVVVKDIPENVIAGGNPCRVIKGIDI